MYFFFNWRVVALQCCVDFCHTPTRISRRYWMSPPSWTSLPPPTLSQPSGLSQSTGFELSAPHRTFPPAVHFRTWQCTCSMLPPQFAHPSLPSVSASLFSASVSPLLPCWLNFMIPSSPQDCECSGLKKIQFHLILTEASHI